MSEISNIFLKFNSGGKNKGKENEGNVNKGKSKTASQGKNHKGKDRVAAGKEKALKSNTPDAVLAA